MRRGDGVGVMVDRTRLLRDVTPDNLSLSTHEKKERQAAIQECGV
jgi:hypothetical protein